MDLWDYFHTEFEHTGSDAEVNRVTGDEETRFGERDFAYPGGTYASNRPDRFSAGEGGEAVLYDQTGDANRVRGVFYFGEYRTYAQGVSFINFNDTDDFNRADYFLDVITELTGYGGTFTGEVISNKYEEPIPGAVVEIIECNRTAITDENGLFVFERVPIEAFHVRVTKPGHTDIDEIEFTFDGEMELDASIRMRNPELALEPGELGTDLGLGNSTSINVMVTNPGDGPLEYSTSLRGVMAEGGFWDQLEEVNSGEVTGDSRLQASVFFQDHFWIVGGVAHDEPNMLYKVTRDGELVDSWEQQSYSNYGWRNLCTDGEYLYGVDSTYIAQIDPQTGQVTGVQYPTGLRPCWAVTYEDENELFWVASMTTDIFAIDRMGTRFYTVDNDRRFRISGLFYYPDDVDGYKLYILSNAASDTVELWKVNTENSDAIKVLDLPCGEGEEAGGCNLTNELHPFTWSLVVQMQAEEDWMRIYEATSDFYWLSNNPVSGQIDPNGSQEMEITFSADAPLQINQTYEAFMQFSHNTPVEESIWIPITMNVTGNDVGTDPVNSPVKFGLNEVYPNPFNPTATINFTLDRSANINLTLHDLTGRELDVIASGNMAPGQYSVQMNGETLPSGLYMVRLNDGNRVASMKVILLR